MSIPPVYKKTTLEKEVGNYWTEIRMDFFRNSKPLLKKYWNDTHKVYLCPECKFGSKDERGMVVHLASKFGCRSLHSEYENPYTFKCESKKVVLDFD
jgi:hypothetical protein